MGAKNPERSTCPDLEQLTLTHPIAQHSGKAVLLSNFQMAFKTIFPYRKNGIFCSKNMLVKHSYQFISCSWCRKMLQANFLTTHAKTDQETSRFLLLVLSVGKGFLCCHHCVFQCHCSRNPGTQVLQTLSADEHQKRTLMLQKSCAFGLIGS